MASQQDRRECTRVRVQLEAELRTQGRRIIKGVLKDVSLNGLFLQCESDLPVGTVCQIGLILDGGKGALYVQARGRVSRAEPSGLGVQFIEILGEESADHLRQLVLYNSVEHASRIQREFKSHLGLKPRD